MFNRLNGHGGEPPRIVTGPIAGNNGVRLDTVTYRVRMEPFGPGRFLLIVPELSDAQDNCPCLCIQVYEAEGFARIGNLAVPPPFRRKGVATLLMRAAIAGMNKLQLPAYLDAAPFDDLPMTIAQLRAFYERFGFVAIEGHPTAMVRQPEGMVAA